MFKLLINPKINLVVMPQQQFHLKSAPYIRYTYTYARMGHTYKLNELQLRIAVITYCV